MHLDKWGVHGRGMALYSISDNAESAEIVASDAGLGSAFVVETNLEQLPEKTDQSSFPTFELNEAGTVSVRGPKNILRTACEFAIESPHLMSMCSWARQRISRQRLYAFGLVQPYRAADRAFAAWRRPRLLCASAWQLVQTVAGDFASGGGISWFAGGVRTYCASHHGRPGRPLAAIAFWHPCSKAEASEAPESEIMRLCPGSHARRNAVARVGSCPTELAHVALTRGPRSLRRASARATFLSDRRGARGLSVSKDAIAHYHHRSSLNKCSSAGPPTLPVAGGYIHRYSYNLRLHFTTPKHTSNRTRKG